MEPTRYSVDDFLLDESFQAFVAAPDSEAGHWWRAWLSAHPEKQAEADQARALVQRLFQALPLAVPAGLREQQWQRLQQALHRPAARPWLRGQGRRKWLASTLALAGLATGLGWWQWQRPAAAPTRQVRYVTGRGQQRTLTLPDGSVVVLNGGSTLTAAAHWTAETPREVWLTGEGYFRVAHRAAQPAASIAGAPANVRFVVHAGGLNVSVLGTQFDVNSRAGSTKIVLNSGRVAVERPALLARETLLMQPGDLVETSTARPGLMRRRVQPALYSAWAHGVLEFRHTSVRDIVQLLRDTYGLHVAVTDSAILRQAITGALPATTPAVLLPALAKSLAIKVTRTGDTVRFLPAGP